MIRAKHVSEFVSFLPPALPDGQAQSRAENHGISGLLLAGEKPKHNLERRKLWIIASVCVASLTFFPRSAAAISQDEILKRLEALERNNAKLAHENAELRERVRDPALRFNTAKVRKEVIEQWFSRVNSAQATNDAADAALERTQVRNKSEIEGVNTTVANLEAQLRLARAAQNLDPRAFMVQLALSDQLLNSKRDDK
jgi:hypothetical protein